MQNKSRDYWKKRFIQIEQAEHEQGVQCYVDIERRYRQAQKQIEGQIQAWYGRFAENNKITIADARKLLTSRELNELKWDVQEYIRYGEENSINGQWVIQLENASARFHISRLEALKLQMQQSVEVLFGNQLDSIDQTMRSIYKDGFYRTAFEIQRGVGVGWDFGTLDEKQISRIINKPWSADGKNFSARVWNNKQKLLNELNTALTQGIVLGQDPQKTIDTIARKMNASKNNAGRLVMTEQAFFSETAQHDGFKELGVEMYEIVATLDSHTSEICQDMDGKTFKMSEWDVGATAPPFHVWCRTTTVPAFGDEFDLIGERAARDEEGKTYYVPSTMTYKEWQKSFVDGDKSGLKQIKPDDIIDPKEDARKNIKDERLKVLVNGLDSLGVEYNPVTMHQKPLNESEIIDLLSGGDLTAGSCASLGLAYVGQKNGINVIDFRGGESQSFFSTRWNLVQIAKFPNINSIFETARSTITAGNKLLKKVEQGKEYYLVVGRHAAIVRKNGEGVLQYLELQSQTKSGWQDFNGNPRFTLAERFGCRNGVGRNEEGFMFDVTDFKDSEELQILLGYINTAVDEQKKGVGGRVK